MKPLSDKVLVKPVEDEQITSGGIVIHGTVDKSTTRQGLVIAVGPGRRTSNGDLIPMEVNVNDIVYYNTYESTPVGTDGNVVVSEQSIYVIKG